MANEQNKAVVLLSGGLDSATVLAAAWDAGFACHALSFDYGQRHEFELESARRVAEAMGALDHRIVKLDLSAGGGFGASALTDDIAVPKDRVMEEGIPATYVPARNTIFLSIALGYAEVIGAFDLFIGVNAVDYSGYPDCRPAFVEAFEKLANLATGVDYGLTHSCYDPASDGTSCGHCDACRLRLAGFAQAGASDPLRYQES